MTDAAPAAQAPERPAPSAEAIFEAEGVVKRFGGIRAVNGATMRVQKGSITALIGPNGAGKTTFFNLITGFYRSDAGAVSFDGSSIAGKQPYTIARLGMVRTFQITKALSAMPVIDNMMLAAPDQPGEKLRNLILRPAASRKREKEVHAEAMELLDVVQPDQARRCLRGHALGRPAQAARARPGADDQAALPAPRRADGGDQPDPRAAPARPHAAAAPRGRGHLPLRRARHGGGDEPLRPGDRDGRGQGDRRRRAARGARRPGRDRRLPRRRAGHGGRDGGAS